MSSPTGPGTPDTPTDVRRYRKRAIALVLTLVGLALLASAAALAALVYLPGRPISVPRDSVLVIDLDGTVAEVSPASFLALVRRQPTVRQIVEALRHAQQDKRVKALVLRPRLDGLDWAKLQELRDAVLEFRKTGKPTVAFLELGGQEDYYLGTACDKVFLVPSASLELTGVATYELFLRGTLDKIGTFPDFLHVGDYKTAVNQMTEHTFTPAHREMSESLNHDAFEQLVAAVSEARKKTPEEAAELVGDGPYLAYDANDAGLVDDVVYEDEVESRAGLDDKLEDITLADYLRASFPTTPPSSRSRIALIYAVGEIATGESSEGESPSVGSDTLVETIRRAREDDTVKAIVLRVDSPGGSTVASDVIWHELMLARDAKPLIVSMSGLAASGGYYISTPAHAIVAQPGTLTGSIGIFTGKYVVRGSLEKLGVNVETVTSGPFADYGSMFRPFTDEERERVTDDIQNFYEGFLERVAESRHSTPDKIHEIAQGRVWTGRQAKEIGLVDELGGLGVAVRLAKEHAKLPASANVPVVTFQPARSWSEYFSSPLPSFRAELRAAVLSFALGPDERQLLARVTAPVRHFRAHEPLALMPYIVTR
ncbi:MAG: signal peptide peptidase SppA [Vicinamibacterales bacterium]